MRLADLDYALPEELIAQSPADRRDAARLLVVPRTGSPFEHATVKDLPRILQGRWPGGGLLVLNDTRVRLARLQGRKRDSGGAVELLRVERQIQADTEGGEAWRCLVGSSKPLRPGTWIELMGEEPPRARALTGAVDGYATILFLAAREGEAVTAALDRVGEVPLPPYIRRSGPVRAASKDAERYQTIYARNEGAIAAPTAGLHFTGELLDEVGRAGFPHVFVTLHVGAGTFAPIRVDEEGDVTRHRLHEESFEVPTATENAIRAARSEGRPVIAVGTTTTRALESYALGGRPQGSTDLYIVPGHEFRVVDGLLTNFHLPRSTLLLLVYAMLGRERALAAYAEAVRARYRFYSFGDAMLIT